ncbi:MAG: DUF3293 domain-containing protein [Sulfuricurvum sp.]|jgi:hypothetical protein|uniref:DUF3293 domain-containing protein n=1 Tax=Sulfuricurvum sp. TaxID=2025608 RepID=UPI0025F88B48|nr:DUF3293 domain-containing protein [Sulfuricurvum sp.]MCK9372100.1 DUF3293 domain-containing protein [Sulfuricurvum sp.]
MKEIYDNTHFRISHNLEEIDFTIDTLPIYAPFDAPFAILTAWNPNNQPLSLEENTIRNEQLFEKLLEYGHPSSRLGFSLMCKVMRNSPSIIRISKNNQIWRF